MPQQHPLPKLLIFPQNDTFLLLLLSVLSHCFRIACEPLWQYHCSAIFWLKCKTESCLFLEPLIIGGGRGGRSAFRHTCLSLGLKQENEAVNSNPKKHLHTPGSNFFSSCSGWRNENVTSSYKSIIPKTRTSKLFIPLVQCWLVFLSLVFKIQTAK